MPRINSVCSCVMGVVMMIRDTLGMVRDSVTKVHNVVGYLKSARKCSVLFECP